MLIAQDISTIKEYSLREDTYDNKTIFQLGQLNIATRAYLDDVYAVEDKDNVINTIKLTEKYVEFVRFGLKGWTNFVDKNKVTVEFKTVEKVYPNLGKVTIVSDESLNKLTLYQVIELGGQIIRGNKLTEADLKN
jgi:hypothetical protein